MTDTERAILVEHIIGALEGYMDAINPDGSNNWVWPQTAIPSAKRRAKEVIAAYRAAPDQPAAAGAVGEEEGFSPIELELKERARKSQIMHNGQQYVLGRVFSGAVFEMRTALRHARNDEFTLKVAIKENDALRAAAASQRLTSAEWRRDALEAAAQIAERYPTDGKSIASDIRAMSSVPRTASPSPSSAERDLALIEAVSDWYCQFTAVRAYPDKLLATFNASCSGGKE